MRRALTLVLLLTMSAPVQAQDACFPVPAVTYDRSEYRKATGRQALLAWKAQTGLFDLRVCESGWRCPSAEDAKREVTAMQGDLARLGVLAEYTAGGKTNTAVTASRVVAAVDKDGSGKKITGYLDALHGRLVKAQGAVDAIRQHAEDSMKESKVSLLDAVAKANLAERKIEILDRLARTGARRRDEKFRAEREKLVAERDQSNVVRFRVEEDHNKYATMLADAKRASESFKRGLPYIGHFKTAYGLWENASAGDPASALKAFADTSKLLAEWELKNLDAATGANNAALATMSQAYKSITQARQMGKVGLNTESTIIARLSAAQATAQADASRLELNRDLLSRLNAGAQLALGTYKHLKEYGGQAVAAGNALRGLDGTIRGNNDALRGDIPPAALSAINYFDGLAFVLNTMAGAIDNKTPEGWINRAAVETVASWMQVIATVPKAFIRAMQVQQQGATFDRQTLAIKFLHPTAEAHPALRGLRILLPDNAPNTVVIPNGSRTDEVRIDGPAFEYLLQALTTWTSLSGANPDQEALYRLAKALVDGGRVKFRKPNNGSLLFSDVYYDVMELANPHLRKTIEEDVGRALAEVDYLNQARGPGAEPFRYHELAMAGVTSGNEFFGPLIDRWNRADRVQELKKLNEAEFLLGYHERLDEAFFMVYGKGLPASIFGAVLAQTGSFEVRTVDTVGALEKLILSRRNRVIDDAREVRVAQVTARQTSFDEVRIDPTMARVQMAPGTRVCLSAQAAFVGGAASVVRLSGDDALGPATPSFSARIDWSKLKGAPELSGVIVAAVEGGAAAPPVLFRVALDPPVTLEEVRALPDRAFPGQDVNLRLVSTLSDLAPGLPTVTITARPSSGPAPAVTVIESHEENAVALVTNAKLTIPADAAAGTTYEIAVEVDYRGWTSKGSGSVSVIPEPDMPGDTPSPPSILRGGCSDTALKEGGGLAQLVPGLPYYGEWRAKYPTMTIDPLGGRFDVELKGQGYRQGGVVTGFGWRVSCAPLTRERPLNCNDLLPSAMPRGESKDAGLGDRSCTTTSKWPAHDFDMVHVQYAAEKDGVFYTTSAGYAVHGPVPCCQAGPMEQLRGEADAKALAGLMKLMGVQGLPPTANPLAVRELLPSILRDGSEAQAQLELARASIGRQDLAGATAHLQRAADAAPQSAVVQYNLTALQQAQGNTVAALKHAENYLRLAPDAPDHADMDRFSELLRRYLAAKTDTPVVTVGKPAVVTPPVVTVGKPAVVTPSVGLIGCFADSENRDLSGFNFYDAGLTVSSCRATCASKGFAYAGVQYVAYCFCGNSYGKYGPSTACTTPCGGAPSEICGGPWSNSVYPATVTASPVTPPVDPPVPPPGGSVPSLLGTWSIACCGDTLSGTLIVTDQQGASFSGRMEGGLWSQSITGQMRGDVVEFERRTDEGAQQWTGRLTSSGGALRIVAGAWKGAYAHRFTAGQLTWHAEKQR